VKIATSHATSSDTFAACERAYADLLQRLGTEPSILYLAWSVTYPAADILAAMDRLAPGIHLHGASSCLGAMTESGFVAEDDRAIVMMGIADADGAYGVGMAAMADAPREAAKTALFAALDDAERPGEMPALVRLSAPPGAEEQIIAGIEDILGKGVPIIGGSAADNDVSGHWQLLANGRLDAAGIVISVMFPSVPIAFAFHSGYSPTTVTARVTRAHGRVLQTLDGEPAAVAYNRWTEGAIDAALGGGNVLASTTLYPLGRKVGELGGIPYYQLSHPDQVTEDGGLSLFSDIAEGDEVVLMQGSIDSLVSRAGRVAAAALDAGEMRAADISGAMVVYCAGCMLTVRSEIDRVAQSLNDALGQAPFLGTFTFGEQGCFAGGENRHGNLMISVVVFGR
jgi:hypothetical protein